MDIAALIARHSPRFRMVLADIGSAGGLHGRWRGVRGLVNGVLFEPREGGEVRREGGDTIHPVGLGQAAGEATLNVTALPNMSSTLEPNAVLLQTFAKKGGHTLIVERMTMQVDTLDAVAEREGLRIDAIKVDTQGSELEILRGAADCLKNSVIVAEVEVSFFQRYSGQALCGDVVAFMAEQGFELIDLYRLKRYRRLNAAGIGNRSLGAGQRAGRLAYGDAIFLLREDRLRDRIQAAEPAMAEAIVLRSVLAMIVYGKPDMAAHLFDQFQSHVGAPLRAPLASWFAALGKRRPRAGVLHHLFDYLARHV